MSISDTNKAQKYASIAEVAAAQCKIYTEEARLAPEYTNLAKEYAESAEISANSAQENATQAQNSAAGASNNASTSQGYANSALESSQSASNYAAAAASSANSAEQSAQDAQESAQTASAAVNKTIRVSDTNLSPLGNAADRIGKVLTFNSSGNVQLIVPASGSAADVLNVIAEPDGSDRVGYGDGTITEQLNKVDGKIAATLSFSTGGRLESQKDFILFDTNGTLYYWTGAYPKDVAPSSTPTGTGGVASGAWAVVSDSVIRSDLALTSGASMMGYDIDNSYPADTVGYAISKFTATDGTREVSRGDRAAQRFSTDDFIESDPSGTNDIGAAANAALAVLATKTSASLPDVHNGTVRLPQGGHLSKTGIKLDVTYPAAIGGITLAGEGITSTILDMRGSAAGTHGIDVTAGGGALYPNLRNFGIFYAPGSGFKINTATRAIYESLQSAASTNDNFYFGNVFMSHMRQLHATSGLSHGINFARGTTFGPTTDVFTKTTITSHSNYARGNSGFGIGYNDIHCSHSFANGSDGNGQHGYRYGGFISGFAATAEDAESNQLAGYAVLPDGVREQVHTLSFRNIGAYGNNRANNGNPNLLLVQPTNGASAWVSLENSYSIPGGAGSSSKDVLVVGSGAHLYLKGDCVLPNGFEAINGGYIHFEHVPKITNKTVPLSTATAICSLKSTQGKTDRYAGEINIVARSNHPSNETGNMSQYKLFITKTDANANWVKVIAQGGFADQTPGAGATAWPVFTWTLNPTTNNLVATPVANVGGVEFWFEFVTSGQIVAYTL